MAKLNKRQIELTSKLIKKLGLIPINKENEIKLNKLLNKPKLK